MNVYAMLKLLLLRCALNVSDSVPLSSPWSWSINESSGVITSVTNGVVELVDSFTMEGNLPVFWLGSKSSLYFETILDAPCIQQ